MTMGNIKKIMVILIRVDEITELMMIETMIAQEEVMIRSNGDCPRKRDNKCRSTHPTRLAKSAIQL